MNVQLVRRGKEASEVADVTKIIRIDQKGNKEPGEEEKKM